MIPVTIGTFCIVFTFMNAIPILFAFRTFLLVLAEKFEGQLLPACVDPSHLLTNKRVKVTRDGILRVDKNTLHIADRYPDVLNHTLVTEFLDRQNVAFACRVFSPLVAEKLAENGDHNAGEFVSLMHNWYTAVDSPGIAVVKHVKRLLATKEYLLHKHLLL